MENNSTTGLEATLDPAVKNKSKFKTEAFRLGLSIIFLIAIFIFVYYKGGEVSFYIIIAAMIGGYMAINIGANDVANNVAPAVGSKALTLTGAIIIAAIFEASGALVAGGDVVGTIKSSIIDPNAFSDKTEFVWLMMAALLAGAVWLNLATYAGAPVSTTHSIVGGVLGAGIAAGGVGVANWSKMGAIAASWVISPMLGGLIAAGILYLIKRTITYKTDMRQAAKKVVPILLSFMSWSFITYLCLKGLKHIYKLQFGQAAVIGLIGAVIVYFIVRPYIAKIADSSENTKGTVNKMFIIPLIFSAALLSFAHGANDVANAVGPLAAINQVVEQGIIGGKAGIPLWIMLIGALGISIGLSLYGPKLIKTVGTEITELDQSRAFCISMAAAFTVIVASQLGLPVSSTHIAVGAVFGVGFLREYLKTNYDAIIETIEDHHEGEDLEVVDTYLKKFNGSDFRTKGIMLKILRLNKEIKAESHLSKKERKILKSGYRKELVKRSAVKKIAAAWVITVPASGLLGALFFFTIRGILLP